MSIEIVKFVNDKYGIRKRNILHKIFGLDGVYMDFKPVLGVGWQASSATYFKDCQSDDLESVNKEYLRVTGKYVKEIIATS